MKLLSVASIVAILTVAAAILPGESRAHTDVAVGINLGVPAPVAVYPEVYPAYPPAYVYGPPVYYGPGVVVGAPYGYYGRYHHGYYHHRHHRHGHGHW